MTFFSAHHRITCCSVYLAVPATPTSLLPHPTNSLPVPHNASSLATRQITAVTAVMILRHVGCSPRVTWCLTSSPSHTVLPLRQRHVRHPPVRLILLPSWLLTLCRSIVPSTVRRHGHRECALRPCPRRARRCRSCPPHLPHLRSLSRPRPRHRHLYHRR